MSNAPIAAVIQLRTTGDVNKNMELADGLVRQAAAAGAKTVLLPEAYPFLGEKDAEKFQYAEALDDPGPILKQAQRWARDYDLWILAGGIPEAYSASQTGNTFVVIKPSGDIVASYRKMHLFDIDIPGKVKLRESDNTVGGTEVVTVETPLGVTGLSICYDMRFPELYRRQVNAGATVLTAPAAFTQPTGHAHWHTLLRARAIENQCYMLAAAQWGRHHRKRVSYGHSVIIDPWGRIVAEAAQGNCVITAPIDQEVVSSIRRNLPCLSHRRLRE